VGALTGNVTGNISGGTVAGSTGTFTGDVDIADKIVHTGDTNTALRFPAADTITAETGGSERLRITSDGKVGLGRNDPAFALDIKSSGYSTLRLNNSSETGHGSHDVRIVGGGSNYHNIYFEGSTFKFNTYNGSSVGERLRITSDGELVVGMTDGGGAAEDARLQVRGDTYAKAKIQVLGTHNDDNPVGLTLAKSRSSGNTILGDNDDIGQIDFASNDGNGFHNVGRIMVSHDGSGNGNDDLPSMMRFFTTANAGVTLSERLRIASNGDLLYASSDRNYASWYHTPTNSNSNAATSSTEDLIFGTAVIANTDVYNTTNGRYTAPVDGLYHIRFNGLIDNNGAQAGYQIKARKNGSAYGPAIAYHTRLSEDSTSRYQLLSGSAIMYMSANDYATIYATAGMHTSQECNFFVYLIRGTI